MIPCKPVIKKLTLSLLFFVVFSISRSSAQDGQQLFMSKCASCHNVFKDMTGPMLRGVINKEKYTDKQHLYDWIHRPQEFYNTDPYYVALKAQYKSTMTPFESLKEEEIDAIFKYIETAPDPSTPTPGDQSGTGGGGKGDQNAIIFGVISLILAIITLILMQVNSNLKKLSDDAENIQRPEPVPFFRNKIYIAMIAIFFFALAGFFVSQWAIGMQRQQGYEPKQPIYYSHKVHAGINQISCLYCHGNAWESRHAAVPSTNVCMNCHKTITSYDKGPKLYDTEGNEINGTAEIAKLYKFAGFDPKNPTAWDASKAKPIEWKKIHSLPDHVYFNHSQHIRAGKVQCQTCHGQIDQMDEVKQAAPLSMGWCVNCHRQTKVDFNYSDTTGGNKYYSIYEKFHNDIKNHKMDSVTVEDIGGLECQKCHY
jgi:mono/diheme cytochrome c family protein